MLSATDTNRKLKHRFSDFEGADRIDSGNVITTNGLLHEELVALMADPSREPTRD